MSSRYWNASCSGAVQPAPLPAVDPSQECSALPVLLAPPPTLPCSTPRVMPSRGSAAACERVAPLMLVCSETSPMLEAASLPLAPVAWEEAPPPRKRLQLPKKEGLAEGPAGGRPAEEVDEAASERLLAAACCVRLLCCIGRCWLSSTTARLSSLTQARSSRRSTLFTISQYLPAAEAGSTGQAGMSRVGGGHMARAWAQAGVVCGPLVVGLLRRWNFMLSCPCLQWVR